MNIFNSINLLPLPDNSTDEIGLINPNYGFWIQYLLRYFEKREFYKTKNMREKYWSNK